MHLDTLWIDPIDQCSLNCIMCRFKSKHQELNRFSLHDLYSLLIQGKQIGVDSLFFGITAEPTQYEDLDCLLAKSKELGFKRVGISTNFNSGILNKGLMTSLSLIDEISISIDAANKETYEHIRRGASWDLLIDNLNNFVKYWKGNKVAVRFTIQKSNISEISRFVDLVHRFNFLKSITFEPVSSNFVKDHDHMLIEWDYEDLLLCEKELEKGYLKAKRYGIECREYITVAAIVDNKNKFQDKGYKLLIEQFMQDLYDKRFPLSNPCFLPSHTLYVSAAKKVYLCECAYGAEEFILGDLNSQSLKTIWESNMSRQLRKQLAKGIRLELCRQNCYCFDGQLGSRVY